MLRRDPNYTRLPGGGRTLTGNASYWLARDHLLLVDVQTACERYRRFDLRDIRCLTLVATRLGWIDRGILGGASLLFLAWLLGALTFGKLSFPLANGDWIGLIALAGAALSSLTGLLLSIRAGRMCRVEIQTGVQTIPLPGLNRWRKAEQFLVTLTSAVQAAQADLRPVTEAVATPAFTADPEPESPADPEPSS